MFKSKVKKIAIALSIFVITLLFANSNYAKYLKIGNNEVTEWKVAILSDTKELNDTQEIKFKVQDNPNVVNGKIAPGLKATAQIEIDIRETKVPVDIQVKVDTSSLQDCFKLTSKLNDSEYNLGTIKTVELEDKEFTEENGKWIVTLELEWMDDEIYNMQSTAIGSTMNEIKLPVTINVEQHI